MNSHDKRQIEKLKELKKEYLIVCRLSKEERVKRFCKAMRERQKGENKMTILNIKWDTDGFIIPELPKSIVLPKDTPIEEVADWLSDRYGWLVESFEYIPEE